ncbi:hypothetical protein OIU84_026536 [Salix udensis]|uniref:Uncharacterized protein n=1 Tax=Salix udensis TaxID=889485 RepID=A0AAD6KMF9_9ROSI|nr:hypothetical protein OIU84_026536 [Salix udensis]
MFSLPLSDSVQGDGMPSIEPTAGTINDICVFSSSGFDVPGTGLQPDTILLYTLFGTAPKWLPSIENLTEEMEKDAQTTIYDNLKFLTKEDFEKLNLTSLIGTNLLRASMHGKLIVNALAMEPFEYETYREQQTQKKLEEQFVSRITVPKKLPKVNRKLAASVIEKEAEIEQIEADKNETKTASRKKKGLGQEIFEDERFKALFEDKDFEIDENSAEYLALHPMASMKQPFLLAEHFELLTEDEDQGLSDSDNSTASGDEHNNENRKFKKKPSRRSLETRRDQDSSNPSPSFQRGGDGGCGRGRGGRGGFTTAPSPIPVRAPHPAAPGYLSVTAALVEAISQEMEKKLSFKSIIATGGSMSVSSKAIVPPPRPQYGSKGRKCVIRANHFVVEVSDRDLFQYDVRPPLSLRI